LLVND